MRTTMERKAREDRTAKFFLAVLAAFAFLCFAPWTVSAQPTGPMTVERIHSGCLAAPEVKVTEIDHKTSELVGAMSEA